MGKKQKGCSLKKSTKILFQITCVPVRYFVFVMNTYAEYIIIHISLCINPNLFGFYVMQHHKIVGYIDVKLEQSDTCLFFFLQ